MRRVGIKALRVFAAVWLTLAAAAILIGTVMVGVRSGIGAALDLFSPWNVANIVVIAVTLAPGIGARMWADKLEGK